MQKNSKTNWWTIIAIIIIGIPVGYVTTAIIDRSDNQEEEPKIEELHVNSEQPSDTAQDVSPTTLKEGKEELEKDGAVKEVLEPLKKEEQLVKREEVQERKTIVKEVVVDPEVEEQRRQQRELRRQQEQERREQLAEERRQAKELKQQQELERKERQTEQRRQQQAEKERKAEEQRLAKEEQKEMELNKNRLSKEEAQSILASGKASSKIPDGCKIIVNGSSKDYQNFRMGVSYNTYTNINVTNVSFDKNGKVSSITVKAKVQHDDD